MCGIAGFVQIEPAPDETLVAKMLSLLAHRGPDASGLSSGRHGVVGQTRLAVIDLRTGDPPITNEDGSIAVALNGEIYNFRELRAELVKAGHEFRTEGDTEVIAHLSERRSPAEVASALEGMFAVSVYDDRNERLWLIRDRVGKKPLYYWTGPHSFVFASEIKALLAHPDVPRDLDEEALDAYLTFGYVPTPRTFFRDIRSVPPGHVLSVGPGSAPSLTPYWEPRVPGADGVDELDASDEELAGEVRRLLDAAVRRRLIADVDLGAFLSGGIDSSAVVALMARAEAGPVRTFTIGFDDRAFDERRFARLVADRYGTDHTEFVVKPKAVDLIERLVWHYDQPFGDSSAIPTFLLSEQTRAHVTVALCGDGGDELFAGYERFAAALAAERFAALPHALTAPAVGAVAALPKPLVRGRVRLAQRFMATARAGLPDAFLKWISYASEQERSSLLRRPSLWAIEDYRRVWERSEGADTLARLIDLNIRTYLLDDLLVKVDRAAMAHGLEVRSPFLDRELMEFALRLPRRTRIRLFSLKRILKDAVSDDLPPEILSRSKHGFGVPLDLWFRTELRGYLVAMLSSRGSRVRRRVNAGAVDRLVADQLDGRAAHGHLLWALLMLEVFLRREGW